NSAAFAGGVTNSAAGTVAVSNDKALGTGTYVSNINGAILRSDGGPRTLSNPISLTTAGTIGGVQPIELDGLITVGNAATTTLTVTDIGGLTVGASGGFVFTTSNDILNITNNYNATVTLNSTIDDSAVYSAGAGGADSFIKAGLGTLILSGGGTGTTPSGGIHGLKQ